MIDWTKKLKFRDRPACEVLCAYPSRHAPERIVVVEWRHTPSGDCYVDSYAVNGMYYAEDDECHLDIVNDTEQEQG